MLLRRLVFALSTVCLAAAFFMAAATGGCKTSGGPGPVQTAISDVVECSKGAAASTALSILDDAASALATGNWEGALLNLVTRWGADAVACTLGKIRGDGVRYMRDTAAAGGEVDKLEQLKASRADYWLKQHNVRFADDSLAGAP